MSAWPCVYFSSRLLNLFCLSIDDFQRKRQLLAPTSCCSFKTSRLHTLGCSGWDCQLFSSNEREWQQINLRSERRLSGVERRCLSDYSKDQSGSGMMEGTLASGGERWLRDVATAKSGIGEVVGWSSVEDGCDRWGAKMNLLEKDLEKARQWREVPSSLKKIVNFCFSLLSCLRLCLLICGFFLKTWYRILHILVIHGITSRS